MEWYLENLSSCTKSIYLYISILYLLCIIINHNILQHYNIDGKSYFIKLIWFLISPIIYWFNICLWDVEISNLIPLVWAKVMVRSIISLRRLVLLFVPFWKSILDSSSFLCVSSNRKDSFLVLAPTTSAPTINLSRLDSLLSPRKD